MSYESFYMVDQMFQNLSINLLVFLHFLGVSVKKLFFHYNFKKFAFCFNRNFFIDIKLNRIEFLTLSWRRPLSYRNESLDLQSKSVDWFLYDNDLHHERVGERKNSASCHVQFSSYSTKNIYTYMLKHN